MRRNGPRLPFSTDLLRWQRTPRDPGDGIHVSSAAIVVLGSLSVLCWLAVFAFAFRPTDFRRHAERAPKARRPNALIIYSPTGAMRPDDTRPDYMRPDYTRPASELRWPAPRHSDLPERR
jgi:hypothetical protein